MNIKQFGTLLVLFLIYASPSAAEDLQQRLASNVGTIVGAVNVPKRGYTAEKCTSIKNLVEASIERYRDPVCGGVRSYTEDCDNVKFLKAKTGADGYWADIVNREVGVYLMHGGNITVMPDLVYAGCMKKIGESNIITLK